MTAVPTQARSVALRLLVLAVAIVTAGCIVGWILVSVPAGWEVHVLHRAADIRSSTLTRLAKIATTVGSLTVQLPVAALACAVLLIRRRRTAALDLVIYVAGVLACVNLIKVIVGRPRPHVSHLVAVHSASFPSQHAAQATTVLLAVALLITWQAMRIAAVVLAVVLALLVGLSRVYLGVHYPTDVLAGWLVGATWLFAASRVLAPIRR